MRKFTIILFAFFTYNSAFTQLAGWLYSTIGPNIGINTTLDKQSPSLVFNINFNYFERIDLRKAFKGQSLSSQIDINKDFLAYSIKIGRNFIRPRIIGENYNAFYPMINFSVKDLILKNDKTTHNIFIKPEIGLMLYFRHRELFNYNIKLSYGVDIDYKFQDFIQSINFETGICLNLTKIKKPDENNNK